MGEQDVASAVASKPSSLAGIRLYSPGAIAAYTLLGGFPTGCALYGLNSARRGSRVFGVVLYVVAAASCILMIVGATLGADVRAYGLFGVFGAIGLYTLESGPFDRAMRIGAIRAKWWPPALLLLTAYLLAGVAKVTWGG